VMEEEKERRRTWRDRMLVNRREVKSSDRKFHEALCRSLSSKGDCTEFDLV
jgi:hypothetical protein